MTARKLGMRQLKLAKASEQELLTYTWPGNVRELEHLISRAALKAKAQHSNNTEAILALRPEHFALQNDRPVTAALQGKSPENNATDRHSKVHQPLKFATDSFQREQIIRALNTNEGNWSKAALALEMDRANLARLAKRLGIKMEKKVSG